MMQRIASTKISRIVLFLSFLVLIVGLRILHLSSDAYARLSWSSALLTDEGFYIHNARNMVLFGQMRTDEFNNALIMPLLHLVQVGVFRLVGVGTIQARSISVTCSLLTLWLFFLALRQAWNARVAWLGVLLLGLDPVFVLYNRLALMDTPACLPLVAAFYAFVVGTRREEKETRKRGNKALNNAEQGGSKAVTPSPTGDGRRHFYNVCSTLLLLCFSSSLLFFFLCGVCLALAYAIRGLTAIIIPVPLLILIWEAWSEQRNETQENGSRSVVALFVGLAFVFIPFLLFWYLPHHQEIARVNAFYVREQLLPHSVHSLLQNIRRGLFDAQRGMMPFMIKRSPVLVVLTLCRAMEMFKMEMFKKRERKAQQINVETYLWIWLGVMLCVNLCISYAPSRYYVLFYPPLAAIAALQLSTIWEQRQQRTRQPSFDTVFNTGRGIVGLLLLAWSLGNLCWYADWLLHLSYKQRNADGWLAAHLPKNSVLLGAVAPGLCLNNQFRCVTVIVGLCNNDHPIEKAGPAPRYIVMLDRVGESQKPSSPKTVWSDRWRETYWSRTYPALVRPDRRLIAFPKMLRPFFTVGVYFVPPNYKSPQSK